ncbi:MAG: tryptophan-rich sensory protein [Chitinophagaceae bacterium]|nr:tryptophan-rich sensory protein [Chitinophagaceae bacterium]
MKLIISLLIPLAVGFTGSFFTTPEIGNWYSTLNKPWFNPPSWIFAPVWTTLYVLMGIAMWLVWKSDKPERAKQRALWLYAFQLFLNFWWSVIFFHFHQPGWALVEIIVLWISILLTIFSFAKIDKTAAWLLVPYICWVSFAMVLNHGIWVRN